MSSNNPTDSRLEVLEKKVEKLTDLFAKLLERFLDDTSQPKKIAKPKKVPSSRHLKKKSVGTGKDSSSEDDPEYDITKESDDEEEPSSAIKDPEIMKKFQVDRGAIKFVLSGANIMCPGLTSPGGALDSEVLEETPVAIMAEGKQHALAIGFTKMSAKDIKAINKGIGVDNMHYLNDGLWKMERFE